MKLHRISHRAGEDTVAELVRIGAEEAHYLAEWGASDALQEAAQACGRCGAATVPHPPSVPEPTLSERAGLAVRRIQTPASRSQSTQPGAASRWRSSACAASPPLTGTWNSPFCVSPACGAACKPAMPAPRASATLPIDEARQVLSPLLELLGMLALRVEAEEKTIVAEQRPFQLDDAAKQAGAAIAAELAAALHTQLPDAHVYPNKYAQLHNSPSGSRNSPKLGLLPTITVLVDDEAACYQVLHQVHKLYTPVDGGVDDSLYAPGDSGYRALNVWALANAPAGRARISFSIAPRAAARGQRVGRGRTPDALPRPDANAERLVEPGRRRIRPHRPCRRRAPSPKSFMCSARAASCSPSIAAAR